MNLIEAIALGMIFLPGFYLVLEIFLTFGMKRLPASFKLENNLPSVSVLISCKNEEDAISQCLTSIAALDYPKDLLEVIIVDDESTDSTHAIISEYCARNSNFKLLSSENLPTELSHLKAKARGIAHAARHASGEWLFITDADAQVHPQWIRHMLSGVDEKTGMIGGMLSILPQGVHGKTERMIWAWVLPYAFGMAGWGVDFICVGPNMAIRRKIYNEAGGLEKADFKVAEDLAMFKMVKNAGYHSTAYVSPETTISLLPVPSVYHLFSQQRRWYRGGFEGGLDYVISLVLGFGAAWVLSMMLMFGWLISWKLFAFTWMCKALGDLTMFTFQQIRLKKPYSRFYLYYLAYTTPGYVWLLLSFIVAPRIHWKGDNFSIKY